MNLIYFLIYFYLVLVFWWNLVFFSLMLRRLGLLNCGDFIKVYLVVIFFVVSFCIVIVCDIRNCIRGYWGKKRGGCNLYFKMLVIV